MPAPTKTLPEPALGQGMRGPHFHARIVALIAIEHGAYFYVQNLFTRRFTTVKIISEPDFAPRDMIAFELVGFADFRQDDTILRVRSGRATLLEKGKQKTMSRKRFSTLKKPTKTAPRPDNRKLDQQWFSESERIMQEAEQRQRLLALGEPPSDDATPLEKKQYLRRAAAAIEGIAA